MICKFNERFDNFAIRSIFHSFALKPTVVLNFSVYYFVLYAVVLYVMIEQPSVNKD